MSAETIRELRWRAMVFDAMIQRCGAAAPAVLRPAHHSPIAHAYRSRVSLTRIVHAYRSRRPARRAPHDGGHTGSPAHRGAALRRCYPPACVTARLLPLVALSEREGARWHLRVRSAAARMVH
eukprot:gene11191-12321_t